MSDIVSIIYQWRMAAINTIKSGKFPLWNPSYFLGMPLFANFQNSLINFTNIVFFLPLSKAISWGLMIYLQSLFSLISIFLYLKSIKIKTLPSLIASLVYSYSLFTVAWLEYGVHIYTAAFLPLILLCIEKTQKTKSLKYLTLLSILVALQIYGGYPQYAIYTLIFTAIYHIVINKIVINKILSLSLFVIIGLGLASPLLLPGYELINKSIHHIDTTADHSNKGFLPSINLLTALSPNYFGNPGTRDYEGVGFYDNNAFYPGLISIIATIFYLFHLIFGSQKIKNKRILLFFCSIPTVFILSTNNPLSLLLRDNFGFIFSGNGIATRYFVIGNLAFSVLTASMVDSLVQKKNRYVYFSLELIFLWQLVLLINTKLNFFHSIEVSFKNTLYSIILLLPTTFLLIKLNKSRHRSFQKILLLMLFAVTATDLFYNAWKYLPFSPSKYLFPSTPTIDFLKKNASHYRISGGDAIPENMWQPYDLSSADGYDAMVPLTNFEYLFFVQNQTFPTSASRAFKVNNYDSELFHTLSEKYILKITSEDNSTKLPTEFNQADYKTAYSQGKIVVVENTNTLPRARFVYKSQIFPTLQQVKEHLSAKNFSSDTAYIVSKKQSPIAPCQPQNQTISFIKDQANLVELETDNNCPAILILSDAFFPGWKATINDQPTPIYQTNYVFRSIILPAGKHQIKFSYLPSSFVYGIYISVISGIILISLNLIKIKKRNKIK